MENIVKKRKKRAKYPSTNIPPSDDKRWSKWTAPLLDFIRVDCRTMKDIKNWAKKDGMTVTFVMNALSWLLLKNLAESTKVSDSNSVFWKATDIK